MGVGLKVNNKMRAFIAPTYGPASTQSIQLVPKPVVKNDEILVKVKATTVNRSDTEMRRATYWFARIIFGLFKPKCAITGCEFAGIVEEIGPDVTKFKVGDKVFGFDGDHYQTHAEYFTKSQDRPIALIPNGFSYEQCVALGEGASYASNGLRSLKVGKGTSILINGATGAIGSAAVQLSKNLGAVITATARAEHFDLVKSWGAQEVIDYTKVDFTNLDRKFHVVIDAVGKSRFSKVKKVLKPDGLYYSSELGPFYENIFYILRSKFYGRQKVVFDIPKIDGELMIEFAELLKNGLYTPHIDRTYSFEEIMEASQYVESAQKVGSVLIKM